MKLKFRHDHENDGEMAPYPLSIEAFELWGQAKALGWIRNSKELKIAEQCAKEK